MKLPRWLLISMWSVSVLSVLSAAVWWWITWPERTAREFFELLRAEKIDKAERMMGLPMIDGTEMIGNWIEVSDNDWKDESKRFTITRPRTLTDYVMGRVRFIAPWPELDRVGEGAKKSRDVPMGFVAVRGQIVEYIDGSRTLFISGSAYSKRPARDTKGASPTKREAYSKEE